MTGRLSGMPERSLSSWNAGDEAIARNAAIRWRGEADSVRGTAAGRAACGAVPRRIALCGNLRKAIEKRAQVSSRAGSRLVTGTVRASGARSISPVNGSRSHRRAVGAPGACAKASSLASPSRVCGQVWYGINCTIAVGPYRNNDLWDARVAVPLPNSRALIRAGTIWEGRCAKVNYP
ncbi:hypothetical protein LMG22931_05059 [Paraburkholderia nemoris]|nr:hypothetical protein LMG22931_05059 [Paraburkholderia nemoris]